MYALLWIFGAGLAWLSIRLSRRPGDLPTAIAWVLAGTAGLLTHYFFAFGWLACLAWLVFVARRRASARVAVLACVTLLLVLPWYALVPASLRAWRVTAGWQNGSLEWPSALAHPFLLAASLLSGTSPLGGWRWADHFALGLFAAVAIWIVRRSSVRRLFGRRRLLLWLWLAASCLGPLVFDVLRHTFTSEIDRYVVPALPAAMLLAALLLSRLPPKLHAVALSALLLAWLPGALALTRGDPRSWEPYRKAGARLMSWAQPGDVVVVHSVPPGVVGLARYMKRDIPLVSWVEGARPPPVGRHALAHGRPSPRRARQDPRHACPVTGGSVASGARSADSAGPLRQVRRLGAVLRAAEWIHVPCRPTPRSSLGQGVPPRLDRVETEELLPRHVHVVGALGQIGVEIVPQDMAHDVHQRHRLAEQAVTARRQVERAEGAKTLADERGGDALGVSVEAQV